MAKISRSKLIKKLDSIFSVFIRLRDCDKKGMIICPLCGTKIFRKKAQNMHFISRGIMKYRYDEDNCHAGCMRCNVILHGNYIAYTRRMQNRYGIERIDKMINDKQILKITTPEIESMIEYYEEKTKELMKEKSL